MIQTDSRMEGNYWVILNVHNFELALSVTIIRILLFYHYLGFNLTLSFSLCSTTFLSHSVSLPFPHALDPWLSISLFYKMCLSRYYLNVTVIKITKLKKKKFWRIIHNNVSFPSLILHSLSFSLLLFRMKALLTFCCCLSVVALSDAWFVITLLFYSTCSSVIWTKHSSRSYVWYNCLHISIKFSEDSF